MQRAPEAPELRWLRNNIKTADELKAMRAKIWLSNESDLSSEETSDQEDLEYRNRCFRISRDTVEDLLDAAASLQMRDPVRQPPSRQASIVLFSRIRHGLPLLDELVLYMAKELHGSLLSVHPDELEDIAHAFHDLEQAAAMQGREQAPSSPNIVRDEIPAQHLLYHYFGARAERKSVAADRERCRAAFFDLLNAAMCKSRETGKPQQDVPGAPDGSPAESTDISATQSSPLILYLRDGSRLFTQNRRLGRRVICRMRDAVNHRRRDGLNIILVVGVAHTEVEDQCFEPDTNTPWKACRCSCVMCSCTDPSACVSRICVMSFPVRKLRAPGVLTQEVTPIDVPEGWAEDLKAGRQSSLATVRIQSFKRKLHAQLGHLSSSPPDLLEPDCDWFALLPQEVTSHFASGNHGATDISTASTRIIGRCIRREMVALEDIRSMLLRMESLVAREHSENPEEEARKEAETVETVKTGDAVDSAEDEKSAKQDWESKLIEIKQGANKYEEDVLSCLVDPDSLQSDFDDVVLDQDILASIKTLVHLSKLRPEASSKALVSQIKITGALLYGPPGTGKTHLARAIAKSTGSSMLIISPAIINHKFLGESEKMITATFTLARKLFPCIVFIDEVDALFYRRSSGDRRWERSAITEFLQSMDGLAQDDRAPFVLAATNKPMDLDSAFLRRLPHKIPFPVPDGLSRANILSIFLKKDDLNDDISIQRLASATMGFSGSDLKNLCAQAGLVWAVEQNLGSREGHSSLKVRLTKEHFKKALDKIQPSVSQEDVAAMEEFTRRYGPSKQTTVNLLDLSFATNPPRDTPIPKQEANLPEETLPVINPPDGWREKPRLSYNYNSLPGTTSIRLLKIYMLPDTNTQHLHSPIRCSVVVADLTKSPDYFALSYTWGDPRTHYTKKGDIFPREAWDAPAFEIDCNGSRVSVGTNLYTAIIAVRAGFSNGTFVASLGARYQPQDPNYCFIWIDALCINQADLNEKSTQIPLMDRIYSQARATVMWLGGSESLASQGWTATAEKMDLLFDKLNNGPGSSFSKEELEEKSDAFDICDPETYAGVGLDPISRPELVSFGLLFSRSWFKRAWVIQEWVLSPHCVFLCGDVVLRPEMFVNAASGSLRRRWMKQIERIMSWSVAQMNITSEEALLMTNSATKMEDLPVIYTTERDSDDFGHIFATLLSVSLLRVDMGHGITYEEIDTSGYIPVSTKAAIAIDGARGLETSNPHDKIFAFHGLFKDSSGRALYPAPDYNKPVCDVYAEAAAVLVATAGISLLHSREPRAENPHGLPSWVPDFGQTWGPRYYRQQPDGYTVAAGMGTPRVHVMPNHVLGVRGYCVDTVSHVQMESTDSSSLGALFTDLMNLLCHIPETSLIPAPPEKHETRCNVCVKTAPATGTPQDRFEVLWRTAVEDQFQGQHPAPSNRGELHMDTLEDALRTQYQLVTLKDFQALMSQVEEEKKNAPSHDLFLEFVTTRMLEQFPKSVQGMIQAITLENEPYDRAVAVADLPAIQTSLAMFRGRLPYGSAARSEPPFWSHHQELWRGVLEAHSARNFMDFCRALENVWTHMRGLQMPPRIDDVPYKGDPFYEHIFERLLCVTAERRLALSAGNVEVGDEIWILAGLDKPVALRKLEGERRYALVGCLYVHGIMHGEAVPDDLEKIVEIDIV